MPTETEPVTEPTTLSAASSSGTDYFFGPLAVLTAIVFGSAAAISFGLMAVAAIFWMIGRDSARVASEVSRVPLYCSLFLVLCAVAGVALYGAMRRLAWQWYAQAGMWTVVVALAWWFTRKSAV